MKRKRARQSKTIWHGQKPGARDAATKAVIKTMARVPYAIHVDTLCSLLGKAPYAPVAQAIRRLRHAGLVRRADGGEGPGRAATYALTAKGKRAAERAGS